MKNRWILLTLTGFIFVFPSLAQAGTLPAPSAVSGAGGSRTVNSSEDLMRRGLERFKQGRFEQALYDFREITLESSLSDYHGSAYFWITKCYLALGNWGLAEENLLFFLEDFEGHPFYEEGFYQKGRILFMKESYQESIGVFYDFIERYPESSFIANSLFWVAESLYNLGHYREAEGIYHRVVTEFPASYKVETAEYRLSLIDLFNREEVLLNLLKLSHEEYLGSLEEFQRRERTYEQALGIYQRRILQLTEVLEAERTAAALAASQPPPEPVEVKTEGAEISSTMLQLMELKNQVLELKGFYIDLMEEQYQGGM